MLAPNGTRASRCKSRNGMALKPIRHTHFHCVQAVGFHRNPTTVVIVETKIAGYIPQTISDTQRPIVIQIPTDPAERLTEKPPFGIMLGMTAAPIITSACIYTAIFEMQIRNCTYNPGTNAAVQEGALPMSCFNVKLQAPKEFLILPSAEILSTCTVGKTSGGSHRRLS